ncbi:hypothetical protein PTRA_a1443 [Pseudoalteromonas translucida KMM 520]|uniref:Smf/DprA SLOG domain-containing protein n=1 Tax=Pseudoalteromonas translucida KMM 520 TaxID=1315283 RepID=A0A0U2WY94_9GAMM|nr:DNA-processing protein DprA [Pseudoalteromonas translucida]ALS32657.1 hypothetical protein PTRA_a1443 [Pseudoalteromonas translucida KMM 520]
MDKNEYWKLEIVAFYALQSIHGIGFRTLYKIAAKKISFRDLIKTDDYLYFEKTLRLKLEDSAIESEESWEQYKKDLWVRGVELARKCQRENIRVIFYDQEIFPKQLRSIPEPPMWLFIQGNLANLHNRSVAIVGSRKATEEGLWLTTLVVAAMAKGGLVSVSGLAEGIDQKAHIDSLRFKIPTIAVLGTGIDSNYPKGSEVIRAEILANEGTIVSEYLIGQSYSAQNFVRRNRIQAGLAETIIPVEWKVKSGTAHTVNFTKEYNRFLVMPHLPNTVDNDELQLVRSYPLGLTFCVPEHSGALIDFIFHPYDKLTHVVESGEGNNQIQMDI